MAAAMAVRDRDAEMGVTPFPEQRRFVRFQPTPEQRRKVEAYAAVGLPQEQIALVLDIDTKTLRKYFRKELDRGAAEATAKVGGKLFALAMAGDVAACIFWMKARAGWSERVHHHHTAGAGLTHEERLLQLAAEPLEDDAAGDEGVIDGEAAAVPEGGAARRVGEGPGGESAAALGPAAAALAAASGRDA